jgi:guanine deaminase
MQSAGLRAFVGKLSMDRSSIPEYSERTSEAALAAAEDFIGRMNELTQMLPLHRRLVEPVLTPRFVPTCSDALLRGLGDLAERTGVRVQSHLAEAQDQVEFVRQERGTEDCDVFDQVRVFACLEMPT